MGFQVLNKEGLEDYICNFLLIVFHINTVESDFKGQVIICIMPNKIENRKGNADQIPPGQSNLL